MANGERSTAKGERQPTRLRFALRHPASVALLVALTSLFFAPLLAGTSAQEPLFKSNSSDLVVLPVVVTDRDGRYVSDLPADRFTVFDNGRRVPIELFTNQDTPVTIGLLVDASGSMRAKLGEVIAATMRFARSSNPEDELFAVRFNDDVLDLMEGPQFLMASDLDGLESAVKAIRPDGRTALYDGLMDGLDHLEKGTRARKVLVVISDGGDNASESTLDAVLVRARNSSATIYTVGIFDRDDMDQNPRVLKSLAQTTGGERFLPRSAGELLAACERIAREIRGGYTIGYVPPAQDGAYHHIRVEIAPTTGRKLNLRTRPGYFAGRPITQP